MEFTTWFPIVILRQNYFIIKKLSLRFNLGQSSALEWSISNHLELSSISHQPCPRSNSVQAEITICVFQQSDFKSSFFYIILRERQQSELPSPGTGDRRYFFSPVPTRRASGVFPGSGPTPASAVPGQLPWSSRHTESLNSRTPSLSVGSPVFSLEYSNSSNIQVLFKFAVSDNDIIYVKGV